MPPTRPATTVLMERVSVTPDGCWEWQGAQHPKGYGQMRFQGHTLFTHRVAWVLAHGPVPDGLELDHLCRNRLCCNPKHLEPVTHLENIQRGDKGPQTHCKRGHELTEDNVYRFKNGYRTCKACAIARSRAARNVMNGGGL